MTSSSAARAACASGPAPNAFESVTPRSRSRRAVGASSATAASTIAPSAGPRPASSIPSTSLSGLVGARAGLLLTTEIFHGPGQRVKRLFEPLLAQQALDAGRRL